jgi:Fuc2NAc and GlcNAc transferase
MISAAHRKHAYQRAVQSGLTHQTTIIISIGINFVIAGLIFVSRRYDFLIIPLFLINVILLYGITLLIDKKIPFK